MLPFIEMLLLKQRLTPVLWDDSSMITGWYQDNDQWADEAIRRMKERGFAYSYGKCSDGIIVRFSHEKLTELAGAPERPIAIARAITLILNHSDGVELLLED